MFVLDNAYQAVTAELYDIYHFFRIDPKPLYDKVKHGNMPVVKSEDSDLLDQDRSRLVKSLESDSEDFVI